MQKRRKLQISNKIKLSNAARKILIVFAIAIFAFGSGSLIKALTARKEVITEDKEEFKYTNKLKINTKVNLKDNEYVKEDEITDKQTYISDLISNVDIDLKYNYIGTKQAPVVYNYKIEAIVSATYVTNNKSYDILNKAET